MNTDLDIIPVVLMIGLAVLGLDYGLYCGFPLIWVPCGLFLLIPLFSLVGAIVDGSEVFFETLRRGRMKSDKY